MVGHGRSGFEITSSVMGFFRSNLRRFLSAVRVERLPSQTSFNSGYYLSVMIRMEQSCRCLRELRMSWLQGRRLVLSSFSSRERLDSFPSSTGYSLFNPRWRMTGRFKGQRRPQRRGCESFSVCMEI